MSLADFYRRLSRTALLYGDPVSARIYARQAANSKDPAKALAKFYAEFFNALEAASGEVGEELVKTTADELESEGWTLDRDDSGEWHATPLQKVQKRKGPIQHARRTSALRYAAARAPKGGVTINGKDYRGGQFIPASQVAQASPEVKAKIEASQKEADERSEQKKQERRGRTVNAGELKGRLAGYAERHGVVKTDTHDAKAAYRMLSRHHGDLVLPRLQELADEAEKALGRLNPENPATERAYNRLGKNLAVLHRMIELHEQGYTGKRTPKEPKHDTQPEQQPGAGSAGTGPELGGTDGGSNGGTDGKSPPKEDERIVTRRADITKPGNPELVPESVRHFLKPHQVQGVAKSIEAIDQHGGFLLADGTGVGKTREILALARRYADQGKKVLIVTKHEAIKPDFKKNTFEGSMLHDSKAMGVDLTLTDGNRSGQVNLTTYKYLREVSPMVDGDTIVIFDEAHSLKNSTSIQTKAGREISKKAKGVLYATATPADKPLQIPYLARARIFGFRKWDETYEELGCIKKTIHAPGGKTIEKWEIDPKVGIDEVYRRLAGLYDRMTEDGLMMKREISFQGVNVNVHRVKLPPEVHETMARIEQAMQGDPLAIKAAYEQVQKELSENAKQLEALGEDATEEAKAPFLSKQDSLIETVETLLRYRNESQNKGLTRAKTLMHQRRQIEPYKIPAAVESAKKELAEGRQVVLFVSRVNTSKVERPGFAPVESEGTAKSLRKALEQAGIAPSEIVDLHGGAKTKPGDAMNAFQSGKSKVIIATVESGGPQPYSAKVLTPSGWREMGSLKVGDVVIAGDGSPTRILNIFEQGVQPVYQLTTRSGAKTRCTADHLWATRRWGDKPGWKIRNLQFLMDHDHSKWMLPVNGVAQFDEKPVPLNPYLLGVLLGNGSFRKTSPTFCSMSEDVIADVEGMAQEMGLKFSRNREGKILTGGFAAPFAAVGTRKITKKGWVIKKIAPDTWKHDGLPKEGDIPCGNRNILTKTLKDLGLWGKDGREKFIPQEYLFNSEEIRLGVLRGLMDTDGSVSPEGDSPAYCTTSLQLAEGVAFLVRSLGGVAFITRKTRDDCYYVKVGLSVCPFKVPEKADKWAKQPHKKKTNNIKSIEPAGEEQCRCLLLDHPSHLYITDDFIVTHNTGVNLDDTTGDRPRSMILLTPPLSGVDNLQALGRVWRLTTKSLPRVQYISSDADIDRWNSALVANKMKTLGASVSGDVDELEFPDIDLTEDEIADRGGKLQGKEEPPKPYIWGPLIRPKMEPGAAVPAGELVRVSGKTFDHLDRIKGLGRAPGKEFDPQTKTWMMPKSMADKLRHLPGLRFSDTDQPKPATPREPGAKPAPPPEPPKFPEARKQAILQGLRNLASMDEDRARERNNAGFNGTDGGFGHDLAARDSLSDRQAEAAAAMLAKYKRQLGEELHGIITGKTPVQDPEPVTPAPEPPKEIPTGPQFKSESDYVGGTPTARKTEPSPINLPPEPTKAEPKPLNITTKNVTTKNGPRVIASWSYPSEAFWQAKKAGKLPPEVGVNKYKDVWQVTIWGHSDAQTREIARKLQDMGVVKFQRGRRALHYLKLATSALSYGDAHSARIYRRQADNA